MLTTRLSARATAFAGSALLAGALAVAATGCTPVSSVSVTSDSVTVTGQNGTEVYSIPEINLDLAAASTVTVTGTDSILAVPDLAELSFGVVAEGATSNEAQANGAQLVDGVTAALLAMGVPQDAISTYNVHLHAQYDWSGEVERVVGYQMSVNMTVKGLSLDETGAAIATVTAAGVDSIHGVSFYCSNYDEQYNEALASALELAGNKAQAIAQAGGMELGAPISVVEGYDGQTYRYSDSSAAMYDVNTMEPAAEEAGAAMGGLALDPGTIEISATVTVEYEVK